jgi:hypothetical protein
MDFGYGPSRDEPAGATGAPAPMKTDYDFYVRKARRLRVEAYSQAALLVCAAIRTAVRRLATVSRFTDPTRGVCDNQASKHATPNSQTGLATYGAPSVRANDNRAAAHRTRSA